MRRHPFPHLAENIAVQVLLILSLCVGFLAAFRQGFLGQDFRMHVFLCLHPAKLWYFNQTNPPITYLLGWLFIRLFKFRHFFLPFSIFLTLVNGYALLALYYLFLRRVIHRPLLRLACFSFLLFLPVRLIHSSVIAADALCLPMFVLLLWAFLRVLQARDREQWCRRAMVLGGAGAFAILIKFSFISLTPFYLFLLIKTGREWFPQPTRRAWGAMLIGAGAPALMTLIYLTMSATHQGWGTSEYWLHANEPSDMNWSDLLLPKKADISLLAAPEYYFEHTLDSHLFSYGGLLNLAIFTDSMNFFQRFPARYHYPIPQDGRAKIRTPFAQHAMQLACLLGLLWVVLGVWSFLFWLYRAAKDLYKRRRLTPFTSVFLAGGLLFAIIFFSLPFVRFAYLWGFWLPRLILPAIVVVFIGAFRLVDLTSLSHFSRAASWVAGAAFLQSAVHVSFLLGF